MPLFVCIKLQYLESLKIEFNLNLVKLSAQECNLYFNSFNFLKSSKDTSTSSVGTRGSSKPVNSSSGEVVPLPGLPASKKISSSGEVVPLPGWPASKKISSSGEVVPLPGRPASKTVSSCNLRFIIGIIFFL